MPSSSELIQMLEQRVGFHERRQERLALEEQWLTCMAFWSGKHRFWVDNGRFYDNDRLNQNENEVRYKVNLIRARTDAAVAKILDVNAEFGVAPITDKAADRENAELSNKVFDHIRSVTDYDQQRLIATQWAVITGNVFLKCYWDPLLGDPSRFYWDDFATKTPINPIMLTPPQRQQKEDAGLFEDLPSGDLAISVCSPFGAFADSASRDKGMKGCHWFAERHFVDIDRIAERFGVNPNDIMPIESDGGLDNYEEAIAYMSSANGFGLLDYSRPEDKRMKRTLYIEYWQRPDSKNKKGLRVCYAGGKILNDGKTDNPHIADRTGWSHIPYVHQVFKPHPGRFWGAGLVEDLLNPQYALNETRSAQISFIRAHGQPATYVEKGAGIDTNGMTAEVGRVYSIADGFKVQPGPTPQMPAEVMAVAALTEGDLNNLASQSQIDGAKMPGELRSGSAVEAINKERFIGLSIPAKMAVRATRDVGKITLAIAQMRVTKERVMKTFGEDRQWLLTKWKGSDLNNDVVIIGAPDVGDSLMAQREQTMDMLQMGVFNPDLDRETKTLIYKMMKFHTNAELFQRGIQAERHAENCIQEMIADPLKYGDIGYPVLPWQDAEAETAAVVAFMYTTEFGTLDPRTQALITDYWAKLQELLAQQVLAQAAQQEAQGGGPDAKGKPSPPKQTQQQQ